MPFWSVSKLRHVRVSGIVPCNKRLESKSFVSYLRYLRIIYYLYVSIFYINTFEFDRRIPDFIGDLTLTRPRCSLDRRVQPNSRKLLHFGIPSYLFFKKVAVLSFVVFCVFCGDHFFPVNFFFSKVLWHVCGDHKTAKTTLQSNLLFQD